MVIDPLNPTSLKAAREKLGLTRTQLAVASGVADTTIMRIEKGDVDPSVARTWKPLVEAVQAASKQRRRGRAA